MIQGITLLSERDLNTMKNYNDLKKQIVGELNWSMISMIQMMIYQNH